MLRRAIQVLVLMLVLAGLIWLPVETEASEIHPAVSNKRFLFYRTQENTTIVYPQTFQVRFTYDYETQLGWKCPRPTDASNYRYEVERVEWEIVTPYTEIKDHPVFGKYLISYTASISVVPQARNDWWILCVGDYVKIYINVYMYVRIERPPAQPVAIRLWDLVIPENQTGDRITLRYTFTVKRLYPDPTSWTRTYTADLLLYPWLLFFELNISSTRVDVVRYGGYGDFDQNKFIAIGPIGNIRVNMCLNRPPVNIIDEPPFTMTGYLMYRTDLQELTAPFSLDSSLNPPCREFTIPNAILIPGNYTGNRSIAVFLKSGAFETTIPVRAEIPGLLVAALNPFVLVMNDHSQTGGHVWKIRALVSVMIARHGTDESARVQVAGTVYINNVAVSLSCPEIAFNASGPYRCIVESTSPPYNPSESYTGSSNLVVYLRAGGQQYSDSVSASVVVVTHGSIYYIVMTMYGLASRAVMYLLIFWVLVYVMGYYLGLFGRSERILLLVSKANPVDVIIYLALVLLILYVLPFYYTLVLRFACMTPEHVFRQAIGCPVDLSFYSPEEAVAYMFSYYDRLLISIKADFAAWAKGPLEEIAIRMIEIWSAVSFVLIPLAIVLVISMNSSVPGSIAASLLGFVASLLPVFYVIPVTLGAIATFLALVEIFILLATLLILLALIVGVVALSFESPYLHRIGEPALGAALFYFLLMPPVMTISYGIYEYAKHNLEVYLINEISSRIPVFQIPLIRGFVPPLDLAAKIYGFVALSSITLGIILFTALYFLRRSGLMGAIGEQLIRLLRR